MFLEENRFLCVLILETIFYNRFSFIYLQTFCHERGVDLTLGLPPSFFILYKRKVAGSSESRRQTQADTTEHLTREDGYKSLCSGMSCLFQHFLLFSVFTVNRTQTFFLRFLLLWHVFLLENIRDTLTL